MAPRLTVGRITERIEALCDRLGSSRNRPVFVYGWTKEEVKRNLAEFLESHPDAAGRPGDIAGKCRPKRSIA